MIKRASWGKGAALVIVGVWLGAVACAEEDDGTNAAADSGTGGVGGTGGGAGSGTDSPIDDSGCVAPQGLFYTQPGCGGAVAPVCAGPSFDACLAEVCGCDGTTVFGCGFYSKPFQHFGNCTEGGTPDGASDSG